MIGFYTLTFRSDWILHPNISELWFYILTFGSVSKSPLQLVSAVKCHVILLTCLCVCVCQISSKRHSCNGRLGTCKTVPFAQRENKKPKKKKICNFTHEPNSNPCLPNPYEPKPPHWLCISYNCIVNLDMSKFIKGSKLAPRRQQRWRRVRPKILYGSLPLSFWIFLAIVGLEFWVFYWVCWGFCCLGLLRFLFNYFCLWFCFWMLRMFGVFVKFFRWWICC